MHKCNCIYKVIRMNKAKYKKYIKRIVKRIFNFDEENGIIRKNGKTAKRYQDLSYQIITREGTTKKIVRITGVKNSVKNLVVPEKIKKYPVEVIQKGAFKGNKNIKSVTLPRSVRVIGSEAFYGCSSMREIELPPDLETINKSCFEGCISLQKAVLPYELKKIAENAFKNCKNLNVMYHYMKKGIGARPILDKNLKEDNLPSGLVYIGRNAFEGCEKIEYVYIPYGVKKIPENAFKGCKSIKKIWFHNEIKRIENNAFYGCSNLKIVKLPRNMKFIGDNVFDESIRIQCYSGMLDEVVEKLQKFDIEKIDDEILTFDSKMIPRENRESRYDGSFYSEEELDLAVKKYEFRTPCRDVFTRSLRDSNIIDSRYSLKNGEYIYNSKTPKSSVKIIMTGDLMCRASQVKSAWERGAYNFDASFEYVRGILSDSDLTIGNMESMISESSIYTDESYFLDDRVHLNAPDAFLSSVRGAGFDVVVNAQNHAYDTGTRGVFETLKALNKYQLMHTGIFAGGTEKRYLSTVINGIHIAIISYFDQARQKMKRVNFSEQGIETMFNNFSEQQIKKDIENAKNEGAEFIIAYCHWGKEYTKEITKRQEKFAQIVANAGADYLFGSHSHCIQPYSVILTEDGRKVPVLYSAGNFMSDMSIKLPEVRDTLIAEIELDRNEHGKVYIKSEGYYPCLIRLDEKVRGKMVTIPIENLLKKCTIEEKMELEEDLIRIGKTVGELNRFKMKIDEAENPLKRLERVENKEELIQEYEVSRMGLAKQSQYYNSGQYKNEYHFISDEEIYKREIDESVKEARIICAGQIAYDSTIEIDGECFGKYEFRKSFKTVSNCFENADFVIGNLVSMVSTNYPTMRMFRDLEEVKERYCNARIEFVEALKDAGFSCLAMANPYNVCTDVDGIFETEKIIGENGLIVSGIGEQKDPLIDINGIKIAFISYVSECVGKANIISDEGGTKFLNEYEKKRFENSIFNVKKRGAEFIIVYANCGNQKNKYNLKSRQALAEDMAEAGADYVICTVPTIISSYYKYKTNDGRIVPIASSIGSFISGDNNSEGSMLGVLLNITVRKTFDKKIEVYDNYIPLKIFKEFHGVQNSVMPALAYFNKSYNVQDYSKVKTTLSQKLGSDIKINEARAIKMKTHYKPNFTVEELYKFLGASPSKTDLEKLGEQYKKPVKCIVSRRTDLVKGCVAAIGGYDGGYQRKKVKLGIKHAVESGAVLVISNVKYKELPCIVVEKPVEQVLTDIAEEIINRYDPITIAITGSVGKTTTKDLMSNVFRNQYKEFHIEGNNNTIYTIRQVIQKLDDSDEVYIQEVHGGTIGAASRVSQLIKPDICVITSIGEAHLGQMGSMENVIAGKMQITDGMREDGVLIINDDNKYLHEQKPSIKTIRYSSYNSECDYYAQNIVVGENEILFQIVSKGGSFDEPGVYDAKLNIQGEHNVNNAVGVFAAARQANIPPHKIIAGLASYRTEGVRQNIINVGGIRLLVDVYSSNPISLTSAMKTLETLPVENGGRRIAVVGELPDQGENSKEIHYNTGKAICKYDFDVLLCIGPDSEYIAKAVKEKGRMAYSFKQRETINSVLADIVKPGDVVLFKASTRYAPMQEATIEPVFGEII